MAAVMVVQPISLIEGKSQFPVLSEETNFWAALFESIGGLAFGFSMAQMPHLWACVQESDDLINQVLDSIKGFSIGEFDNIAHSFRDLSSATVDLKQTFVSCPQTDADALTWKNLDKSFVSFTALTETVGLNLGLNGKEIYAEWDQAMLAAKNDDWFTFGSRMGVAAQEAVTPVDMDTETKFLQ